MSWLFSQALVAEFLADSYSAGAPFALLNMTPMPQAFLLPDRMTDFSRPSRFGMTFGPLTDGLGEELLKWYRADFRAKTSAQQDKGRESRANDPACGLSSLASLARYDHDTCSWRIPQYSLLGGSELFSETWPRSGLMLAGECWELPPLVPRIAANGSGFWPTPRAQEPARTSEGYGRGLKELVEGKEQIPKGEPKLSAQVLLPTPTANAYGSCQGGSAGRDGQPNRPSLNTMAAKGLWPTPRSCSAMAATITPETAWAENRFPNLETIVGRSLWPTPTSSLGTKGGRITPRKGREGGTLIDAVSNRTFPTPTARDWKSGKASKATMEKNSRPLSEQIGGQLNPTWVCWMMGWPHADQWDWTSLDPAPREVFAQTWEREPPIPRVAHGIPARVDRLRCIGNGQVPQCAAEAWRILSGEYDK